MQMRRHRGRGVTRSSALLRVLIPRPGIQGVLGQWRRSVAAPPKLLATGWWLVICNRVLFIVDLQILICVFAFSSPATKMPRTSASRDDAVVGQNVPSTTVDPSKGTGTTLPVSSSNVDIARDKSKQAVIVRPSRKLGVKMLAFTRAPR